MHAKRAGIARAVRNFGDTVDSGRRFVSAATQATSAEAASTSAGSQGDDIVDGDVCAEEDDDSASAEGRVRQEAGDDHQRDEQDQPAAAHAGDRGRR